MTPEFVQDTLVRVKAIKQGANEVTLPPAEGGTSDTQKVILFSLVKGTRGYLERLTHQINGTYENGWYDACAVMIRRFLETLIIEAFEHHKHDHLIKNSNGDFLYLADLISTALSCTAWNLTRGTKQALPKLKAIGDKSAHSRRFTAQRGDVDTLIPEIRVVVQEFLYLANLK